jgi:hypothetical protein
MAKYEVVITRTAQVRVQIEFDGSAAEAREYAKDEYQIVDLTSLGEYDFDHLKVKSVKKVK